MKKTLFVISLFTLSSTSFAVQGINMATGLPVNTQKEQVSYLSNPAPIDTNLSTPVFAHVGDGWSAGIQIGNTSGSLKYSQPTNTQTHGVNGPSGGLHVGYGYTFYSLYFIGAEAYGNLENSKYGFIPYSAAPWINSNRTISNNYGLVLMPGFHLSPSNLLYGKAGVNRANLKVAQVSTPNSNYDQWQTGGDFGLGFKQALTANISLGLEYDWIYYPQGINVDSFVYAGENHIGQNIYQLSLDYQFDKMNPGDHGSQAPLQLTGPYLGAAIGLKSQQYDIHDLLSGSQSLWYAGDGSSERFKLGYAYQFNSWFDLAAEAFFEATQHVSATEFSTTNATKEGNSYGLSLLPGYVINQSNLLFARIGGIYTKLESVANAGSFIPFKVNKTGLELGVGYETALMKNLSLILEYDYTYYPSFDVTQGATTQQIGITDNMMSLGLNYRF